MKFAIWILGATVMIFAASCSLLNPTANQSTIEVSNVSGSACVLGANLDGNNAVSVSTGSYYTFPLVGTGSHTLNFWTSGNDGATSNSCVFTNAGATSGGVSYTTTFDTSAGTVYVASVTESGGKLYDFSVSIN